MFAELVNGATIVRQPLLEQPIPVHNRIVLLQDILIHKFELHIEFVLHLSSLQLSLQFKLLFFNVGDGFAEVMDDFLENPELLRVEGGLLQLLVEVHLQLAQDILYLRQV